MQPQLATRHSIHTTSLCVSDAETRGDSCSRVTKKKTYSEHPIQSLYSPAGWYLVQRTLSSNQQNVMPDQTRQSRISVPQLYTDSRPDIRYGQDKRRDTFKPLTPFLTLFKSEKACRMYRTVSLVSIDPQRCFAHNSLSHHLLNTLSSHLLTKSTS